MMSTCTLQMTQPILANTTIDVYRRSPDASRLRLQQQHAELWAFVKRSKTVENWLLFPRRNHYESSLQGFVQNAQIPTPDIANSVGFRTSILCQSVECGMFGHFFHSYDELFVPVIVRDGNVMGYTFHEGGRGSGMTRKIGRFVRSQTNEGREEIVVITGLRLDSLSGNELLRMERYIDLGTTDKRTWLKDVAFVHSTEERLPDRIKDVAHWCTSVQRQPRSSPITSVPPPNTLRDSGWDILKCRTGEYDTTISTLEMPSHRVPNTRQTPSLEPCTASWTHSIHGQYCTNYKVCVERTMTDQLITLRTAFARLYDPLSHSPRVREAIYHPKRSSFLHTAATSESLAPAETLVFDDCAVSLGSSAASSPFTTEMQSSEWMHKVDFAETEFGELKSPPLIRTRKSYKNSDKPLTPVQIRNREAAKRSNEKKRRYIQSVRLELAHLKSATLPELTTRLQELQAKNTELKEQAVAHFEENVMRPS